jgi:hypothetical protein
MEIVLRPVVAFALFAIAAVIAWGLMKLIRPGRAKSLLGRRYHIIPRNERERRDWMPVILLWGASILIFAWIVWLGWDVL